MKFIKTQTLAEASIFISVAVMAIVAMQVYVKRGLAARTKTLVDTATAGVAKSAGEDVLAQYEPYYRDEQVTINAKQAKEESFKTQGEARKLSSTRHSHQQQSSSSRLGADFAEDDIWEK